MKLRLLKEWNGKAPGKVGVFLSEYHCLFLDRLGSFSSFAFQLKNYEREK